MSRWVSNAIPDLCNNVLNYDLCLFRNSPEALSGFRYDSGDRNICLVDLVSQFLCQGDQGFANRFSLKYEKLDKSDHLLKWREGLENQKISKKESSGIVNTRKLINRIGKNMEIWTEYTRKIYLFDFLSNNRLGKLVGETIAQFVKTF